MANRTFRHRAFHNRYTRYLKRFLGRVLQAHLSRLALDENLIVFESYQGMKFADSPRAMYEYMLNNASYDGYHFVWAFNEPNNYARIFEGSRTKCVKMGSYAHRRAYARAKYWVVNGWTPRYIHENKKTGQVVMQCWHGTPLKRLRADVTVGGKKSKYMSDVPSFDYFISPSKFASGVFKSAFQLDTIGKNCKLIEIGYPRNDKLAKATAQDAEEMRRRFSIPAGKKALLYAPTWRDNQRGSEGFTYDIGIDFDNMRSQLGDDWVILFRAHYFISNQFQFDAYKDFVIDVSDVDDISELYIASDALLTDYSSVFFDYAVLGRPVLFFMYDLDDYRDNLRGFYISTEELPGAILQTEAEVVDVMKNIEEYEVGNKKKYKRFTQTYTYLEDGNATKRAVEHLLGERL